MGCRCKERRKDINYSIRLATAACRMNQEDYQIYKYFDNNEIFYNFEPLDDSRENVIQYIKWAELQH